MRLFGFETVAWKNYDVFVLFEVDVMIEKIAQPTKALWHIHASVNWVIIASGNSYPLFGAKQLPESVFTYYQLGAEEQTLVKFW